MLAKCTLQNPTKIIPLHKWSTARWRWRCCGRVWQMKRMCLTFLHACSDVLRCKTLRSSEICSYSTFGLGTYLPIAAKKTCLLSFDYIFPFIYSTHRVSFSFIFGPYKRQFKWRSLSGRHSKSRPFNIESDPITTRPTGLFALFLLQVFCKEIHEFFLLGIKLPSVVYNSTFALDQSLNRWEDWTIEA